ncbi:MAG: hypothetical protein M3P83_06975, partial [Actinomycetota bacterium]|nr:hypothetical protein [Actinomycetota bacterium]
MLRVCLEVGRRKVFASALDWPGWARAGKTEEQAVEALLSYVLRYAAVARAAGVEFAVAADVDVDVEERLPGTATTDFGAPGQVAAAEREPVSAAEAERMAALL